MHRLRYGVGALLLAALVGATAWPRLPARVVTHWGASGQPDGTSSRLMLVLLVPLIGLALAVVFSVLPRIDPRRANYRLHGGTYWFVANLLLVFLGAVHLITIGVNLGWVHDVTALISGSLGLLFILMGNVLTRVRPNWFIGVRTPWTLSSDTVWRETHRLAGYLFVGAGMVTLAAAALLPAMALGIMLGAVLVTAVVSVGYSYLLWRREQRSGAEPGAIR
jgi:uncharacterized membrane protein